MPKYDLAQLADELGEKFQEIRELHLFGSRKFRTGSVRSDVDILVIATSSIQPHKLRKFICENCTALDLFTVSGGRATSCQNESFIKAKTQKELIENLGAEKFWTRTDGRIQADIEWSFTTRDDVTYTASALPNTSFSGYDDPSKIKIGKLIMSLTIGQFWGFLGAAFTALVFAFGVGFWVGSLDHTTPNTKASTEGDNSPVVSAGRDAVISMETPKADFVTQQYSELRPVQPYCRVEPKMESV